VIVVSAVVLVNWLVHLGRQMPGLAVLTQMKPITAIGLICAAVSLWRLRKPPEERKRDALGLTLAVIVTLLGLLKLFDHLVGTDLHLDQFLLPKGIAMWRPQFLDEMMPTTGMCFLFLGLALLLMDVETLRGIRPAQILVLLVGLVSLLALIGHSYRMLSLYRVGSALPMGLSTATAFAALSAGLLAARPDRGFMMVLTSPTTGGAVARRLLPMAILIPWVLGGLRLMGEEAGYFQTEFGVSSLAASSIVVFTVIIWWNARLLHFAGQERARVQQRLAVQYHVTRVLAPVAEVQPTLEKVLAAVSETLGCHAGALWVVDKAAGQVRRVASWHSSAVEMAEFVEAFRDLTLKHGEGLPGRVWASGEPAWIEDVTRDRNFPRAELARKAGIHGAFAFAIRPGERTYGVMEFFSREVERPDEMLLRMLGGLGTQIGQFLERHWAEQQLRETKANLERSNTDLQEFAYVASHDLSEPLRMVVSYLQLLREELADKLDDQSKEFMGFALEGGQRMQALIKDLLEYSRVEIRGRSLQSTDGEKVLQAALANLKIAITENKATVTHDPLPTLLADEVQLTQVFQNLVGNALKFHGPVAPQIHIGVQRRDAEWLFSVRDNGIGISPRDFERIFVIFQRLHTRREYPGTGMGLAICKRIIERHGGRIWLESKSGEGSTFFFTLPALKDK
jgi:signal transduction histidine kinase